jgi:hypothetical protein
MVLWDTVALRKQSAADLLPLVPPVALHQPRLSSHTPPTTSLDLRTSPFEPQKDCGVPRAAGADLMVVPNKACQSRERGRVVL